MSAKLVSNSIIYVLGDVINKAVPFLLLPVLTRYLLPEEYGKVTVLLSVVSMVTIFVSLGINGSINVNFYKLSKEELRVYIGNCFVLLHVALLISLFVIVLLISWFWSEEILIGTKWVLLATVMAFFQIFTTINLTLWIAEQKPKQYALYQVTQTIFVAGLSILAVVQYALGWQGYFLAMFAGVAIFAFVSFFFVFKRRYLSFVLNKEHMVDALKFGIPLIPHELSNWVKGSMDKMVLAYAIGVSATGVYSVGFQFGMVIGVLVTAFNKAWAPYLFRKLSSNPSDMEKRELVKYSYLYFILILILSISYALTAKFLVPYVIDKSYAGAGEYIILISSMYAFQGMYFMVTNYIFYEKKTYLLSILNICSAGVHVVLLYTLIMMNGVIGAAQAGVITMAIFFLFTWFVSHKVYPMPWLCWSR